MARGLTDPVIPQDDDNELDLETQQAINDLYVGQNMIHDRLVRLEREVDALVASLRDSNPEQEASAKKKWKRGL